MSWQMHATAAYVRRFKRSRLSSARGVERLLSAAKLSPEPPQHLTCRRVTADMFGAFFSYCLHLATPAPGSATGSVVYLHGGAYVSQIHSGHWRFIAKLADSCGRPVHVPIYGLAAQHTAREAHDFLSALFERVSAKGLTYVIGDSSGGGLAPAATQAWVESGGVPPIGLTLIAPWLDIALRNPDIERRIAGCRRRG
jgi:acetyl esterase/lipase